MMKPSSTRLIAAFGGVALSLTTGVGLASAEPDLGPILNTTCTYPQVTAALNAESPAIAAQLAADPQAQGMLNTFLGAPFFLRQQLAQGVQGAVAPEYVGAIVQTANTCNNY